MKSLTFLFLFFANESQQNILRYNKISNQWVSSANDNTKGQTLKINFVKNQQKFFSTHFQQVNFGLSLLGVVSSYMLPHP